MTALAAQESALDQEFISDINANSPNLLHNLYLSTQVIQQAIAAQDKILFAKSPITAAALLWAVLRTMRMLSEPSFMPPERIL